MNNKAFALVETLIVTVFVMTIFTFIFTSLYPLVGKYEAHERYDKVDGKYIAHYYRMHIEKNHTSDNSIFNLNQCDGACKELYKDNWTDNEIFNFCTSNFLDEAPTSLSFCQNYPEYAGIISMYLVDYNVTNFKNYAKNYLSGDFYQYVKSIPVVDKTGYYRLIIEYLYDDTSQEVAYATIEVKKP